MSEPISAVDLLRGTAYITSLARRAAFDSADPAIREKAIKLSSVARELKQLAQADAQPPVSPTAATVGQPEFQTLMDVSTRKFQPAPNSPVTPHLKSDPMDRISVALSMAQGGANAVEIARSLGLTRGEVDLILNIASQK